MIIPASHMDLLDQPADQLTQRYADKPKFFGHVEPESKRGEMELVACSIRPVHAVTYG